MSEWDRILLRKEYDPESPDGIVVNFASILKKRGAERVLDLGCGAGRHTLYLAEQGFEAYGADISQTGLELTNRKLKTRKLGAGIIRCDIKAVPCMDSYFDAVVCVKTIYHQRLEEVRETLSEVYRVLKRGGKLLVNFHSKRSSKYGKGIRVEENTFMREEGPERGVLHHFVDQDELGQLLGGFRIQLRPRETMIDSYRRSLFIVLAEKT